MSDMNESKAIRDVWEWKAACDADLAGLSSAEAMRKLLEDSAKTAKRLGFKIPKREEQPVGMVAEAKAKYGKK